MSSAIKSLRNKAMQSAGVPIVQFQLEQQQASMMAQRKPPMIGKKIQPDGMELVQFEDVLRLTQEEPEQRMKIVKLLGRFLKQEFPDETMSLTQS